MVLKDKRDKGPIVGKTMTLHERAALFQEIQQTLADELGLAFAVPHGSPMTLYDIWEKKPVIMEILKGTEIKKEMGMIDIIPFDRRKGGGGHEETEVSADH